LGLFKDIKGKKGTEGGSYFTEGIYLVRIERCKEGKTRGENGTPFFAGECRILESNSEEKKVGSSASVFISYAKYPDLALADTADFMNAGMKAWCIQNGVPEEEREEVDEKTADAITGEDNILVGTIMKIEAYNKKTREKKDFTKFKYPETTLEDMKPYL
jgi:hypothetical protein